MKLIIKILAIILLMVIIFSLTACSSSMRLIDKAVDIDMIVVTKKSNNETITLEDSKDIAALVDSIANVSVSKPTAQETWNSMGSSVTYKSHYSLQVTTKDKFLSKSKTYTIMIGREAGKGSSKKIYPTYTSREGRNGEVTESAVTHIKELFITEQ